MTFNMILQCVAMAGSVLGIELNARKKKVCWLVWNLGNVFWIWWYIRMMIAGENTWFAMASTVVYILYNTRGYFKWRRDEKSKRVS